MVDSVQVYPPGFRVTDVSDNPVNNAKIKFREAGPGATKTVYSDANLTVALGHTVRTRSDGQPVASEGSSTTTLIYVGPDPYHVEITDENDAVIVPAKDNVKGAAVLSPQLPVIPPIPVIATGSPLTVGLAHNGVLINASANTLTFTDANLLGDGWHVYVRNGGGSGQVTLSVPSGLSYRDQSLTSFTLEVGEAIAIACDGTAFRAYADVSFAKVRIIGGSITGIDPLGVNTFIGFAETAEPASPAANVLRLYAFDEGGQTNIAFKRSDGTIGKIRPATAAEMEAAAANDVFLSPGRQHFHPGHPKMWGYATVSGGTPTLQADYNVVGITDTGLGTLDAEIETDFSSANWAAQLATASPDTTVRIPTLNAQTAGTLSMRCEDEDDTSQDPSAWSFMGLGDHA
jgi:hypothetical protein